MRMRNIGAALVAATALVGCGQRHHGDACKGARAAHVAIVHVDDHSDYMAGVVTRVGTAADHGAIDPIARAAGVHVLVDNWHTPAAGIVTDHALAAPDRAALAHYIASLPPIPAGHRIVYQHDADGWRTLFVETAPVVDADQLASGSIDGDGIRIGLTRDGGKAFERATTDAIGHKLAVVIGDEAVAAPVVLDPIRAGALEITSPDPSGDAALLHRIGCSG